MAFPREHRPTNECCHVWCEGATAVIDLPTRQAVNHLYSCRYVYLSTEGLADERTRNEQLVVLQTNMLTPATWAGWGAWLVPPTALSVASWGMNQSDIWITHAHLSFQLQRLWLVAGAAGRPCSAARIRSTIMGYTAVTWPTCRSSLKGFGFWLALPGGPVVAPRLLARLGFLTGSPSTTSGLSTYRTDDLFQFRGATADMFWPLKRQSIHHDQATHVLESAIFHCAVLNGHCG